MTAKEMVDRFLQSYPAALRPEEQALKDLQHAIRSLRYSHKQLQEVYDETLRTCEFFPKPFNIIEAASNLQFPTTAQRPKLDVAWRTWRDSEGRSYAQRVGFIQPEKAEDTFQRWTKEKASPKEATEAYMQGFRQATGRLPGSLPNMAVSSDSRVEGHKADFEPAFSDYDDSEAAVPVIAAAEEKHFWYDDL